jgi:hypothetical protein
LVVGQGVAEGDFLGGEPCLLAQPAGVANGPGEVDELLDDLGGGDGI